MQKFTKKPRQPDAKQLFDYAIWLLARRPYSQSELLTKFRTRFLPDAELFAATLKKLTTAGFQSDSGFTESFVRSHPDWGPRRLELELKKRGIAADLIAHNLPDEAAEEERCREALAGKLKQSNLPEEYKEKQKLAAFLARRGFGLDIIKRVLQI